MATFVYDRTLADVQAMNAKGTYNASDLNRVQDACDEIATLLTAAGIPTSLTWDRATWDASLIPTASEMQTYLDNLTIIRNSLPNTAPAVPASMAYLTYEKANDIEKMLFELYNLVQNIMAVYIPSGVYNSGGVFYLNG